MKHWIYLSVFALFLGLMPQEAQAQGFLKRARERAEKKLKQRADKAVDETVDKSLDNAEDAVTGNKKTTSKSATTDKTKTTQSNDKTAKTSRAAASSKSKAAADSRLNDADAVLDAYFTALGGKDKLEKINNMYISRSSSLKANSTSKKFVIDEEHIILQGQKYRTLTSMNGSEIPTTFDGKQYFSDGKVSELTAAEIKEKQAVATYPTELGLMNHGYKFVFSGAASLRQGKAYKVVAENSDQTERYEFFYDMETGLKVQEIHNSKSTVEEGVSGISSQSRTVSRQETTVYSDYKEVNGIQVSYKQEKELKGYPIECTVKDVKFDIDLPAETFEIEK